MSRLYQTGFEWQSNASGVEWDTSSGGFAISTTAGQFRSGAASAKILNLVSGTGKFMQRTFKVSDDNGPFYARFYLKVHTNTNVDTTIANFGSFAGVQQVTIMLRTTGALALYTQDGAVQIGSDSSALTLDTWYRVEYMMDRTGATGTFDATLKIDGSTVASSATLTSTNMTTGITDFTLGGNLEGESATTCEYYFDDCAVNDGAGSVNNSWPGDGSIVIAVPTGAGDNAATTGTASMIAEVPPSATATTGVTMVELDSNGVIGDYNVTDSSTLGIGGSDTINAISVLARVREETSGTSSYQLRIKSASGGTTTSTAAADAGNTTARTNPNGTLAFGRPLISETDPTTGVPWTPTGTNSIDNMQIGAANADADSTPDLWVLTMAAMIEYATSSSVTVTPPVSSRSTSTFAPTVLLPKLVTAGLVALALSAFAPSVSVSNNQSAVPSAASLTTSLFASAVSVSDNVATVPSVATLTTNAFAPAVSSSDNVSASPDTGALTTAKFAPVASVSDNQAITPTEAALSISTYAPRVPVQVTPNETTLLTVGLGPVISVSSNIEVVPDTGVLILLAFEPLVLSGIMSLPDTLELAISTFSPSVIATNHVTATPAIGILSIGTFSPSVLASDNMAVNPGTATLTASGSAPLVSMSVTPDTGILGTIFHAPTVLTSDNRTAAPLVAALHLSAFAPTIVQEDSHNQGTSTVLPMRSGTTSLILSSATSVLTNQSKITIMRSKGT